MKFISTVLVFFVLACSFGNQQQANYVLDYEKILTPEQELNLNKLFLAHEEKTTNQIVLVTTPNYDGHESLMLYAVELGNEIGIGRKEKDNGVVIMYSDAQKEICISTGYGTEKILKDEIVKRIIDEIMIPQFRKSETYSGLKLGSEAIITFLEKPENKIE